MSDLITPLQVRQHIETALEDEAIQRLIDRCSADIDHNCGALVIDDDYETPVEVTQYFTRSGGQSSLRPQHPVDSVVSLEELTTASDLSDDSTELVEGEEFWLDGNVIRRKDGVGFGSRVRLVYVPQDVRALRRGVIIQMIKLEINVDPGTGFEGAGSWQHTSQDYEQQRQHLLWSLCPPPTFA